MIFKILWPLAILSALLSKRHPNMKHPPEGRMVVMRIYWFLRDVKMGNTKELTRDLNAEYEHYKWVGTANSSNWP
jgi:hypothetical protein